MVIVRNGKISVRVQFVIVAVSLFFVTTILGMSALLRDTREYQGSFYVIKAGDVEIKFENAGFRYKPVEHGQATKLMPTILNNGVIDAYLFVKLEMNENDFQIGSMDKQLCILSSDLSGDKNVYYYGTNEKLDNFSPGDKCKVFEAITINANEGTTCDFAIKAYAIQTVGYEEATPQEVWKDAKDL